MLCSKYKQILFLALALLKAATSFVLHGPRHQGGLLRQPLVVPLSAQEGNEESHSLAQGIDIDLDDRLYRICISRATGIE